MSKLANILQPRTLPFSQSSPPRPLFLNCIPKFPAMLSIPSESWSSAPSEVPESTHTIAIIPQTPDDKNTAPDQGKVQVSPSTELQENSRELCEPEHDCPWISRLAVEWQVGLETLVPLSQSEILLKQLANSFDASQDTSRSNEFGLTPCTTVAPCNSVAPVSSAHRTVASTAYLSERLLEAVRSGVVSTVEQVLQLIDNQSQSSAEVLIELKDEFVRNARTPLTIDLEKGKHADGRSFTRLCFLLVNDWSNDSGATRLVIGSDSYTYATHTESWNSTPVYLSPDDVISSLKECTPKPVRHFVKPKQLAFKPKTTRPPRHFKAAGF